MKITLSSKTKKTMLCTPNQFVCTECFTYTPCTFMSSRKNVCMSCAKEFVSAAAKREYDRINNFGKARQL